MAEDRNTPLVPRRRGRASFSMATPPLQTPTATLPGVAGRSRRTSFGGRGRVGGLKVDDSPLLGMRTDSPVSFFILVASAVHGRKVGVVGLMRLLVLVTAVDISKR